MARGEFLYRSEIIAAAAAAAKLKLPARLAGQSRRVINDLVQRVNVNGSDGLAISTSSNRLGAVATAAAAELNLEA